MDSPTSAVELLTHQFYEWEQRGRGWSVWPQPVNIEPPFRPFLGHFLPRRSVVDDGQFETPLSRLAGLFLSRAPISPPVIAEAEEQPEPESIGQREKLVEFQVLVPPDLDADADDFAAFLLGVTSCREPISFEFITQAGQVTAQLAVHPSD